MLECVFWGYDNHGVTQQAIDLINIHDNIVSVMLEKKCSRKIALVWPYELAQRKKKSSAHFPIHETSRRF